MVRPLSSATAATVRQRADHVVAAGGPVLMGGCHPPGVHHPGGDQHSATGEDPPPRRVLRHQAAAGETDRRADAERRGERGDHPPGQLLGYRVAGSTSATG